MLDTRIVGALACQKDSYLRSLEATVVSCLKADQLPTTRGNQKDAKSKSKSTKAETTNSAATSTPAELWQIEFNDSVLFPEGGGQPSDHGTITPVTDHTANSLHDPIPIANIQRHGLKCVAYSPQPLEPGTSVRQKVDFPRRWDHMQQHTGQHLLSAIMDTYPDLETLGWGMGAADSANYVDLPRKPSEAEMREIEARCNEMIRENVSVTVETPEGVDLKDMPDDYDTEKGVVRLIRIGDVDANPCCGTHLRQTSHISLILLLSTTSVHGGNVRMSFVCGDRAIRMATTSMTSLRSISSTLGSNPAPTEIVNAVIRTKDSAAAEKKKVAKLLQEIAKSESERAKSDLHAGKSVLVYRAEDGAEFLPMVMKEVRDVAAKSENAIAVLASGETKGSGQIMILGKNQELVETIVAKMKEIGIEVKGGGRPGQWQGKVVAWKKGEVEKLEKAVVRE